MDDSTLPPLPPSDADSLRRNHYDSFYQLSAKEFWGKNEIRREQVQPFAGCAPHSWSASSGGVRCKVCHLELIGNDLATKNGKLYLNGNSVKF